jgi:hypothetical protein
VAAIKQPAPEHPFAGRASTDRPICPLCQKEMADPAPGTDATDSFEVICPHCGAWMELRRFSRVRFRAVRASPSVPPRVFLGLDSDPPPDE